MLVFRTITPLNPDAPLQKLIDTSIMWIDKSPNYKLSNTLNDCYGKKEFYKENNTEKFQCFHYQQDDTNYACIKFENIYPKEKWIMELVFKHNAYNIASISLYYENKNFYNNLNNINKPHILKLLDEKIGFGHDQDLDTSSSSKVLKSDEVSFAANIIHGNFNSMLPCVYISRAWNEDYLVDHSKLAKILSGMAHVFVEPNVYFSRSLQILTHGANPYFGAIGIFFPGNQNRKIRLLPQKGYEKITIRTVFDRVKNALNFGSIPDDLSYAELKARVLKDKIQSSEDARDLQQMLDYAMEDNNDLNERVRILKDENQRLKDRIECIEQTLDCNDGGLLKIPNHPNSYPNQILETILDVLFEAERNFSSTTRKGQILKSVLHMNPRPGSKAKIESELKKIFSNCGDMNTQIESQLNRIGFQVVHAGKHYKIFFEDHPELVSTLPATPSDRRSWQNSLSDLRKKLL